MGNNSRASKYLGFDALKGLNEEIKYSENINDKLPVLSEDEKNNMDSILFKCLIKKNKAYIKYYDKGKIEEACDYILKIDMIEKRIILMNRLKINISMIVELEEKNDWF